MFLVLYLVLSVKLYVAVLALFTIYNLAFIFIKEEQRLKILRFVIWSIYVPAGIFIALTGTLFAYLVVIDSENVDQEITDTMTQADIDKLRGNILVAMIYLLVNIVSIASFVYYGFRLH